MSNLVDRLRSEYPKGTRVELVHMDDVQAPPKGTHGTVIGVDDIGSLLVSWDNGSSLNVVYGEDKVLKARTCSICGKEIYGYGNNAEPVKSGYCCDECNQKIVIPKRLGR